MRYSLSGTVVKSCPNWHKRLSSSSELGAQHVSPHQIPKRPHLQEKDMPVAFICSCHVSCQKLKLQVRKKEVSDCSERLHLKECRSLGSLGHPELQEISKRLKTVRPAVALYLRKSIQSTFTPNRVASIGLMAPCRSHHRNHTR